MAIGLGESDTLGSILRLEFSEADITRRLGGGMGAMGTSVTYVAGTYNGFALLAAPILRTYQRFFCFIVNLNPIGLIFDRQSKM